MKEKIYPTLPTIRESPSALAIEITEMGNDGAHSYRLKVITDVQKYLEEEITKRENFSKKYFRISRVINSVVLRTKSVTKKEMNKCMAEIYDPGGIRTRAARLISQYHNH